MKIKFFWLILPILAINIQPSKLLHTVDHNSLIKDTNSIKNNQKLTSNAKSRIVSIASNRFGNNYEIIVNKDVINEWKKYAAEEEIDLATVIYADLMDKKVFAGENRISAVFANAIAHLLASNFQIKLNHPAYNNCDLNLHITIYHTTFFPLPYGNSNFGIYCIRYKNSLIWKELLNHDYQHYQKINLKISKFNWPDFLVAGKDENKIFLILKRIPQLATLEFVYDSVSDNELHLLANQVLDQFDNLKNDFSSPTKQETIVSVKL